MAKVLLILALSSVAFGCFLRPNPDAPVDDAILATRIHDELAGDRQLDDYKIGVDVLRGFVTITGEVATEEQRTRAAEIAKTFDGVASVQNLITISANAGKTREPEHASPSH